MLDYCDARFSAVLGPGRTPSCRLDVRDLIIGETLLLSHGTILAEHAGGRLRFYGEPPLGAPYSGYGSLIAEFVVSAELPDELNVDVVVALWHEDVKRVLAWLQS
jgi:hypothetical protein